MNGFKKEEKKGGILAFLSSLLGGGTSAAGGASGFGSAGAGLGGFGGLFATKAGMLGMVLGGATIAAGVGVIYNFIGPSSKPVYSPQLFQDTYYEEQANNAGLERASAKTGASAAAASTLDLFREQAKKDGLAAVGGEGSAAAADGKAADSAAGEAPGGNNYGGGTAADAAAGAPAGGGAKLQASAGFGGSKGSASASVTPKLSGGGGMFAGINGKFAPVYRPPAGQAAGKSSAMKGSLASAVGRSSKSTVSNANRKGSFGQAKFAGNTGRQAAYSASASGARTSAVEAFSGETSGGGDVGVPGGGAGMGGSGIAAGAKLKTSDPSMNLNESTPPKVPNPENVSPWKKYTDMAMYAMLAAAVLIFIANMLSNKAKATPAPANAALFMAAKVVAGLAIAAAALVLFAGMKLMGEFGQKWTGVIYLAAGGLLIWKAYSAFAGAEPGSAAEVKSTTEDAAEGAASSMAPPQNTIKKSPDSDMCIGEGAKIGKE